MSFYDTSSLLKIVDEAIFDKHFYISSVTLKELENIKVNINKSDELKFHARKLLRLLNENYGKYTVVIENDVVHKMVNEYNLPETNDNLILASAKLCTAETVYSQDMAMTAIGREVFGLNIQSVLSDIHKDITKGYVVVSMSDNDLSHFYNNLNVNHFGCLINQYLIVKDMSDTIIDKYRWNGNSFETLSYRNFKSRSLGTIKPLDDYQQCAFDAISNCDMVVLHGKAGSGKTMIALAHIMQGIENQKYRKCHIIYHYEPLKYARTLGYEKGSHTEKITLSGSIGNILTSKLGDMQSIISMIGSGTLDIVPTANIRGVEFGENDVVLVTEAQDIDAYTLKTIIQRCKDGCKQIYEGDVLEQIDINRPSGLPKMINVFSGNNKFACVKLKSNYRSEIGELADKL